MPDQLREENKLDVNLHFWRAVHRYSYIYAKSINLRTH